MKIKREQALALLLTLLFAVVTTVMLVCVKMSPVATWPPVAQPAEEEEIFFADIEYEEIKSDPTPQVDGQPASAAAGEQGGLDAVNSGTNPAPPTPVAAKEPSPAKVAKSEEPKPAPGPTKEQLEQEARQRIGSGMANAFNKTQSESGSGAAASGNASTGSNAQSDGLGLDGRRRLNTPDPGVSNATGTIRVKITVNGQGAVTAASLVSSSGFGAREEEVRQAILAASRALKYSPDPAKPSQSGTITWRIK